MGSAVGRVRLVVMMPGFAVVAVLVIGMTMGAVFAVMSFARLGMAGVIGQLADFVSFAGPEKDESGGSREGSRVAKNGAHRRHSRHRV